MSVLAQFHPEIADWFAADIGTPTDAQRRSWPRIAAGEHLLITAPTGSGKTLAAFLWAINAFATGAAQPGATRVLYISPLKALGNDVRANLLAPVAALGERFAAAGAAFPELRIATRTGDTDPAERQRLLRRPPELLITTPESFNLMLATARGRQALASVRTVILDEIHALIENRRGVQLTTGLERLVEIAGEFQRVALSATVRPLDAVAAYVGGRDAASRPRPVGIVRSDAAKRIDLQVRAVGAPAAGESVWTPLAGACRELIAAGRSTLLFANSRRAAERMTAALNADAEQPLAYAHHGSLSREVRRAVEQRLKSGALRAIVATSSLEMGIDIGALDQVLLIGPPPSAAATLQRIGRAGHRVGAVSRGILLPLSARDGIAAAALAQAVAERDIEPLRPLANPLDALAQIVVSCVVSEEWRADRLFAVLTRAAPYATLPREQFDLVLEMLAGRSAGSRVRGVRPRIAIDRERRTVRARKGAAFALYAAGGTIPDRGYFRLRHADTGAAIGELDEEFVWEARIGQVFSLGTQPWRVQRITHSDVLVRPAPPNAAAPPFWRAETPHRSACFSRRIGAFLALANDRLAAGRAAELRRDLAGLGFDAGAAEELVGFLRRQRVETGCDLPHRDHLLVERIRSADGSRQIVLHTLLGGQVNQPLALALRAACAECFPGVAEIHADDDAIALRLDGAQGAVDARALLDRVAASGPEALLRRSLEDSSLFGARFRECAGRALLLAHGRPRQRQPLWMTRLQAKKLFTAVKGFADFPATLEAWRTCLADAFDLPALQAFLDRLAAGGIACSVASTVAPSPFAAGVVFVQTSHGMYADDAAERPGASALSDDLIRRAVFDAALRPRIDARAAADFESRAQRTRPGYVPEGEDELAEWVRERLAIPEGEWFAGVPLPGAVRRQRIAGRWHLLHEQTALGAAPAREAAQMLQFYAPRSAAELAQLLPFPDVPAILRELEAAGTVVSGQLLAERTETVYCDAENLEALIRFQRAQRRPAFEPLPASALTPFLADWHDFGAGAGTEGTDGVFDAADRLRGFAAPVDFFLDEALPPRLPAAPPTALEEAAAEGLAWRGCGPGTVLLGCAEDFALLAPPPAEGVCAVAELFADPAARYTFAQLLDASGMEASAFNAAFWQAVWAGRIAADGFLALDSGHRRSYRLAMPGASAARGVRARSRRSGLGCWPGTWYRVAPDAAADDPMSRLEETKERCRMLLERYGVLTREHANREGGALRWSALFPALRVMELAGEVVSGLFFDAFSGPQFALPRAISRLRADAGADRAFWINAIDPASPCGLGVALAGMPPRRRENHVGYADGRLVIVSEHYARRLAIHVPPDDAALDALLPHLARLCRVRRRLATQSINGEPTAESSYLPALGRHLKAVADHRGVYFEPVDW